MKKILVCGAGGFIGGHLVKKLKQEGHWVRGVDLKEHEYSKTAADEFFKLDLRQQANYPKIFDRQYDEIYQLAADMGGAGYIFTGANDAAIMHNSALINLNVAEWADKTKAKRLFYSSSACIYPEHTQLDPNNPDCRESAAYPANPDSEYGWEKLFSERLFLSFKRNLKMDVHIARFHNIFGVEGTWKGGKEKAPAALCRKVAEAPEGGTIEIWGEGDQTRSFLYIEECVEGVIKLMRSDFEGPVNIGSEEMISINNLAKLVMEIAGKKLTIKNIPGPRGVKGRNSNNTLIQQKLNWSPSKPLRYGLEKTYAWINEQVQNEKRSNTKKAA